MSLYAYEEDLLLYAAEAEPRRVYACAGCGGKVRVRKGPSRVPHFYHLSRAPACRLYSKSEDHLLAQLALQKILPAGEAVLEKPFPEILRIADVAWEKRKIIFEIQCSLVSPKEVEQRIDDYKNMGYQIVWILDDRIFNRRKVRPAERLLRVNACYYATLRKGLPFFYDQFELFYQETRVKRGYSLKVQIGRPLLLPPFNWEKERFPSQILQKTERTNLYFLGDLIYKALLSETNPAVAFSMQNLCALERFYAKEIRRESLVKKIVTRLILEPWGRLVLFLLKP